MAESKRAGHDNLGLVMIDSSIWFDVKERKPTPEDSPILAYRKEGGLNAAALEYLQDGWDGPGWYDHSSEYGMGLEKDEAHYHEFGGIIYWIPLPKPPKICTTTNLLPKSNESVKG